MIVINLGVSLSFSRDGRGRKGWGVPRRLKGECRLGEGIDFSIFFYLFPSFPFFYFLLSRFTFSSPWEAGPYTAAYSTRGLLLPWLGSSVDTGTRG